MTAPRSARPDRTRYVLAAVAAVVGFVWIGQGAGAIPGSFMTGDPFWLAMGLVLVAGAVAAVAWPRLRRR